MTTDDEANGFRSALTWLEKYLAQNRPFGLDEFGMGLKPSEETAQEAIAVGLRLSPKRERAFGTRRWDQPCWQGEHDSHQLKELVDEETVEIWWQVAQEATDPRASSRFADLVWCAHPARYEAAQLAIQRYQDCAGEDELQSVGAIPLEMDLLGDDGKDRWKMSYVAARLGRAREIAIALKSDSDRLAVTDRLVELGMASTGSDDPADAIWFIRELTVPSKQTPEAAIDVGRRSLDVLEAEPGSAHDMEQIADLISFKLDIDNRKAVWRQVVRSFEQMAAQADGPTQYGLLHGAWEMAVAKGLSAEADSLKQQLGQIDQTEFLQPVRSEITLSDEEHEELIAEVENFVDQILDPTSAIRSLARFGGCVAVDIDDVRAEIQSNHDNNRGLATLFETHSYGSRTHIARSEEERVAAEVAHQATFRAKFWAFWIGRHFITRFYETFDLDELASELTLPPVWSEVVAQRFVETLRLASEDRLDAAAHVAAPLIEQTFREWAYLAGALQRPQAMPGNDAEPQGLGAVLSALERLMSEPKRQWLKILLVDSPGMNLRNTIGHGTGREPDQPEMVLLLHAMCVPLGLRHDVADEEE